MWFRLLRVWAWGAQAPSFYIGASHPVTGLVDGPSRTLIEGHLCRLILVIRGQMQLLPCWLAGTARPPKDQGVTGPAAACQPDYCGRIQKQLRHDHATTWDWAQLCAQLTMA